MPNRIIKESIRSSATLAALSDRAERFFHRLITVADDFGRFEADLELLLAECFPRFIARGWTPETLREPFAELVSKDLLRTYVVDGKLYAFFVTFEKHNGRRAKWSKFPAPPASTCAHMQADASTREHMHAYASETRDTRSETREARSETLPLPPQPSPPKRPDRSPPARGRVPRHPDFVAFWHAYPRRVGKGKAMEAWDRLRPPIDACLAALAWQTQSDAWTRDGGRFIPHPTTWLNQTRWEDEPDDTSTRSADSSPIDRAIRQLAQEGGFGDLSPGLGSRDHPPGNGIGRPRGLPGGPGGPRPGLGQRGVPRLAPELEVLPGGGGDPGQGAGDCPREGPEHPHAARR